MESDFDISSLIYILTLILVIAPLDTQKNNKITQLLKRVLQSSESLCNKD